MTGRNVTLDDGVYAERLVEPNHKLEEWLRGIWANLLPRSANRKCRFVQEIDALGHACESATDEELRLRLRQAAYGMRRDGLIDSHLVSAFATIREGSRRVLGKRHHDVQLLAGRVLLQGKIAEMATGEGKTLAGTLAVCAAAASGAMVHVVTVNDYLAERDAEENTPLYEFFGFSVGVVLQDMSIPDRQSAYACPVVYVSNKELTFDYLKDRIANGGLLATQLKVKRLLGVQRAGGSILQGLHVAIVDEADSVLIDEARTPLIISESLPDDLDPAVYQQALDLASQMQEYQHFRRGKGRDVWLTEAGETFLDGLLDQGVVAETSGRNDEAKASDSLLDMSPLWRSSLWRYELLGKALSAKHAFERDVDYIVADDKVQIVDEFTGRVMPDRTWERGLHQMIECKEGCEITGQRKTLSQITYQRFFGRYALLCGMTGTAREIRGELKRVYDLAVVRIPTNIPPKRKQWPARVFRTGDERWQAVADEAARLAAQGRAVLVGTRSVDASEILGELLQQKGVAHTVLNARQDAEEANAVAAAGHEGAITVATNMAGRGTDIRLSPEVEAKGGLHVILTEFHESARVDRQLFGRSARQGNPGTVQAIVSLEDELFHEHGGLWMKLLSPISVGDGSVARLAAKVLVGAAQSRAERRNRRIRLDAIERDRKWQRSLGFVGGHRK